MPRIWPGLPIGFSSRSIASRKVCTVCFINWHRIWASISSAKSVAQRPQGHQWVSRRLSRHPTAAPSGGDLHSDWRRHLYTAAVGGTVTWYHLVCLLAVGVMRSSRGCCVSWHPCLLSLHCLIHRHAHDQEHGRLYVWRMSRVKTVEVTHNMWYTYHMT